MTRRPHEFRVVAPSAAEVKAARESGRQLAARLPKARAFRLQVESDDLGEPLTIPAVAATILLRALTEMGRGHAVSLVAMQAELSTQQAADLLRVSRPHLVRLLDEGVITSRKVGKHRRVRCADVLAYKEAMLAWRREAFGELPPWPRN